MKPQTLPLYLMLTFILFSCSTTPQSIESKTTKNEIDNTASDANSDIDKHELKINETSSNILEKIEAIKSEYSNFFYSNKLNDGTSTGTNKTVETEDQINSEETNEYETSIAIDELCSSINIVNETKKHLDRENKIAQTAGVVNKDLLYEAAYIINNHTTNINYYKKKYKKLSGKNFSYSLCPKNEQEQQTEKCKEVEDAIHLCTYYNSLLTAQGVINHQKKIGKQVGVVNTTVLHHAGEAVVEYKHYLQRGGRAYKRITGVAFNPSKCSKSDVEEGIQNNLLIQKKKELCGD